MIRSELRDAFEASWLRNEAAYRYLGRRKTDQLRGATKLMTRFGSHFVVFLPLIGFGLALAWLLGCEPWRPLIDPLCDVVDSIQDLKDWLRR